MIRFFVQTLLFCSLVWLPSACSRTQTATDSSAQTTTAPVAGDGSQTSSGFKSEEYPNLKRQAEEMNRAFISGDSEGYEIVGYTVNDGTNTTIVDNRTFAVVPTTMTLKTPQGKVSQDGFVLGVSEDNGKNWKFVSGSTKEKLKILFPDVIDKLAIPAPKAPIVTAN